MNILKILNVGFHSIKLMLNPDGNIKSLIYLGDNITKTKASLEAVEALFQDNEFEEMYQYRSGLKQISLESLGKLPRSTFGNDVYKFYSSRNLNVYPMKTDLQYDKEVYISERIRKTHDFLHVLLGYDTDLIGEAKVNAFVANQTKMPLSFLIIAGIMVKYFFTKPLEFRLLIDGIIEGWNEGYKYHPFLLVDWEMMLQYDTNDVRSRMQKLTKKSIRLHTQNVRIKIAS